MINIAIIGITGLTGEELLRIFELHPQAELKAVCSRTYTKKLGELYPQFKKYAQLQVQPYSLADLVHKKIKTVFIALPHGQAMSIVPEILSKKIKVIDLGADFRFKDKNVYEPWYTTHEAEELLSKAVFGISELQRKKIQKAKLLANPGCYVTGVIMPLYPLLKEKIISKKGIIVDAKSGVSGAGRDIYSAEKASQWKNNFKAYNVAGHRHQPEIEQYLKIKITFVPHLLPIDRGILSTCYCFMRHGKTAADIKKVYADYYASEQFVELTTTPPELKDVQLTNKIKIYYTFNGDHLVVISVLDNLVKGASGQAVQNFNIMYGLPEHLGLE